MLFLLALLFLALALLVGNAAAGLASGLAGSLALAAAAVLGAFAQVTGFDGLNMLHSDCLPDLFRFILSLSTGNVNTIPLHKRIITGIFKNKI